MNNWLSSMHNLFGGHGPALQRPRSRLNLEPLEERSLLSANVLQTNLVSDLPGVAQVQDVNLVNPWGISESPTSAFWISDNNSGLSTLYNTQGTPQSLVVSIPTPGDPLGASGAPTGTVFNTDLAKGGFKVSGVSKTGTPTSAAAIFLFATEDGTIVGWNPGVNPSGFDAAKAGTYGIIAVDNSANPTAANGAVYKGLTIATGTGGPIFANDANSGTVLYAANFRSGQIEAYDTQFKRIDLPAGAFIDPNLPKGYAPFNVQELGGKIYVTYAKQNADNHDDVAGPGHGFVDVFNLDGSDGQRLVSRGKLDSPWGLAIAPSSFGNLAGALLVGNFGDGHINAYDAKTGKFLATLKDPDGEPIQIDGLWALKVGNGSNGGDANTVYFTAGIDHERHGLFGSLKPVAAGTPEGNAEEQTVIAALDVFQINLDALQKDIGSGVAGSALTQAIRDVNASLVEFLRAEIAFAEDARDDAAGGSSDKGSESAVESDLANLFSPLFASQY